MTLSIHHPAHATAPTPLPWSHGVDEDGHLIYGPNDEVVADTTSDEDDPNGPREAANARLIVLAANNHAPLIATLRRLLRECGVGTLPDGTTSGAWCCPGPEAVREALAALALAERGA